MSRRTRQPHDETVEEQRPGYCVELDASQLFACDTNQGHGWAQGVYTGTTYFCPPSGPVKVYPALPIAEAVAKKVGGHVTTVPRWNGHFRSWALVPAP